MKPFVVFKFSSQRPVGGWKDILREGGDGDILFFETFQEAMSTAVNVVNREPYTTKAHIVDLVRGDIVADEEEVERASH